MMTVYGRMLLAAAGSAGLLLAALGFQYLGGLAPCPLCVWQRWPHVAAVVAGVLGITLMWRHRRALAGVGAAAMAVSAGLSLYHVGVERDWWEGPGACAGADPAGMSTDALMTQIMDAPLVRCDEVAWSFLGVSMAGWNGIVSLGLAALWAASVVWWRLPFGRADGAA